MSHLEPNRISGELGKWSSHVELMRRHSGVQLHKEISGVIIDGCAGGHAAIKAVLPQAALGRDWRHVIASCKKLSCTDSPARGDWLAVIQMTSTFSSPELFSQDGSGSLIFFVSLRRLLLCTG